jgi:hypothetical protein
MLVQDSLPRTRFDLGSQEVRVSHCFIQRKQPCFSGRASLERKRSTNAPVLEAKSVLSAFSARRTMS